MSDERQWLRRRGELARDGWETVVDASIPGWAHTGLRIGELSGGTQLTLPGGDIERIILMLSGSAEVRYEGPGDGGSRALTGRESVFHGPSDTLFLPAGFSAVIHPAPAGISARVAVCEAPVPAGAPAGTGGEVRYTPADEVPVELRGAGRASRQVHNFGTPGTLDARKLICCEVITPAGNWSSYPPHKHDEHRPGAETRLEEIYYFENAITRGQGGPEQGEPDPIAMFSAYSSPAGQLDINAIVRTGDVALVPFGYHGPLAAAPGYDNYYLNVMAGPDPERAWHISDDPAHGWVRGAWEHEPVDPRLPYAPAQGGKSTT